jgi:hypothetical protein
MVWKRGEEVRMLYGIDVKSEVDRRGEGDSGTRMIAEAVRKVLEFFFLAHPSTLFFTTITKYQLEHLVSSVVSIVFAV